MNYFATALPGLGPVLAEEISAVPGATVESVEFDGRNDVVVVASRHPPLALRTSEDVFAALSQGGLRATPRALAAALVREDALERGLSLWAAQHGHLRRRSTYRVIARVLSERRFLRSQLRDEFSMRIGQLRPRWQPADPSDLEFWILETRPGLFRLGLRLTTAAMRHREGRASERQGALRPTVAAAMVLLAGPPAPGDTLLDPCCGSGTIVAEARAVGWRAIGSDIDPQALRIARHNLGTVQGLVVADVRRLPFAAEVFTSVCSNLPFGKQFQVQGSPQRWFQKALAEIQRVSTGGARIVLLAPASRPFRQALASTEALTLVRRLDLRLLGMATSLWCLDRK